VLGLEVSIAQGALRLAVLLPGIAT
jgi:hypothetical protein